METERQPMDDETMPNDDVRAEDVGAPPHPSPPASMSDRRDRPNPDDRLRESLLPTDRVEGYRERWQDIQSRFVDEPKTSVEQADTLVTEVVQDLQTTFGLRRNVLEDQWRRGEDLQTEDLRVALQGYRTFFDRLLSA